MHIADLLCIAAYFVAVAGVGYWSSKSSRGDSRAYFLGGGNIGWVAIGASLFASNISSEHFIGLAASGAGDGLIMGQFEWLACFILLLLGWVFAPIYLRTGVFTMPEFLERRFNPACRTYLSAISLIAYIFTKVSVSLYAGAIVLKTVMGWDIWTSAVILVVATGLYTVFGGLRAVIYTDFFQAFVLIGGGALLSFLAIDKIGGWSQMTHSLPPDFFNLWKGVSHPKFPWTGIIFGAPILGIWYWCTDQMIVQRTLAAKDISDARRSCIFAGFLKILPVFILVLPGVAGAVLFPDVAKNDPNSMYAVMLNNLLPVGVRGFVIAGLLAALMSSLSSVFNSSSTLAVMDFYKKWRPAAPEKELVRAGQIATVLLVIIGIAWIPFIGMLSNQLYEYLQSVQAYVSPPIAAVFILGIFWRRANGQGALAALLSGFVLGAFRFITELGVKSGAITSPVLEYYAGINFLHFAVFLFVVSVIVMAAVSFLTAPPSEANLSVMAGAGSDAKTAESAPDHRLNVILSWTLVGVVFFFWIVFSPIFWH